MTATARAGRAARCRQTRRPRGACDYDITTVSRGQGEHIAAGLADQRRSGDAAGLPRVLPAYPEG